jgi:hypothetical protein
MTTTKTRAHSPSAEFGKLLWGQDLAGFELQLKGLVLHLILKISQLFFLVYNDSCIGLRVTPE